MTTGDAEKEQVANDGDRPVKILDRNLPHAGPQAGNIAIPGRQTRLSDYFGLGRSVTIASVAVFLLGAGEEIWKKFLPKYLESLGASTPAIGVFGTAKDFLDAVYQYPGGWLADRLGRRRALLAFIALASVGYIIYGVSPSWQFAFIGLVFAMSWSSMASPAIFAVIGDALPTQRRAIGFTFQSLLKRIPMAVSPLLGGALIATTGVAAGVRIGLAITVALAIAAVAIVSTIRIPAMVANTANIRLVWRSFHRALRRLLISDIIIRMCEGLAEVLIVLYLTNIRGLSTARYGALVAIQMTVSILVYLPAAGIAGRIGRKPFVAFTFLCFALFPVAIALANSFSWLVFAFVIGGLREIGEPSRKAMIVDFAEPHLRARTVGLYYLVRSLSITPAAAVGGLLWKVAPETPFIAAAFIGFAGLIVFLATVDEQHAG